MNDRENLYTRLIEYSKSMAYPFHMPGHKRHKLSMMDPYRFDLTEIDGFDNLHDAEGILKQEEERAADLYGSSETHMMINGSTGGILAAIAGVTKRGSRVLVARNCHTSVYHGIELNGLRPVYIWPEMDPSLGIYRGLSRREVEAKLDQYSDICAVFLTSPTYEGVLSDVRGICEAVHARGIPCVIDEAHGAHLRWIGFDDAVSCGADVVIQSLHKTMPALTQTALMHVNGSLVDREKIRRMLSIYQTSSPSYVLMASVSLCLTWLEEWGREEFDLYSKRIQSLRQRLTHMKHLYLYKPQDAFDWGKFVIGTVGSSMSGHELYDRLRDVYGLQMEMVSSEYVLAMTTVGDTEEGFERLAQALEAIDAEICEKKKCLITENICIPERQMEIDEAVNMPADMILLSQAEGRILGDYLYLYPPGIPLLVPGEVLQVNQIKQIQYFVNCGLDVHGGYVKENGNVKVILHHG